MFLAIGKMTIDTKLTMTLHVAVVFKRILLIEGESYFPNNGGIQKMASAASQRLYVNCPYCPVCL